MGNEDSDILENPRLFIYVIGGLSHHEICSISEMQQTFKAQIVPGSNEILTHHQFLNQLLRLHKADIKKLQQGDTTDMEDFAYLLGLASQHLNNDSTIDIENDEEAY